MKMKPNKGVQGTLYKVSGPLTPDVGGQKTNMKRLLGYILAIVAVLILQPAQAQTHPTSETPPAKEDNVKASKGFGAQLWLTDDAEFFTNWNKESAGVLIRSTETATIGKPIFSVIIFANPGADSNGLCNVTGDIIVKKPDGSVYGDTIDANFWRNLPPPSIGQLQLAVDYLGIAIEENDPFGTYTVEAKVIDQINDITITLHKSFQVNPKNEKSLQQAGPGYPPQGVGPPDP